MKDLYGYQAAKEQLENIAASLEENGNIDLAKDIYRALDFYGGMPSEFLGESWLALKAVLVHKKEIKKQTAQEAQNLYELIEQAFKKVGQKMDK